MPKYTGMFERDVERDMDTLAARALIRLANQGKAAPLGRTKGFQKMADVVVRELRAENRNRQAHEKLPTDKKTIRKWLKQMHRLKLENEAREREAKETAGS